MPKYLITFILLLFTLVSKECFAITNIRQQKLSIQQHLVTATGAEKVQLLLTLSSLYPDSVSKAIQLSHEALHIAVKTNDPLWVARGYTNLATLFVQDGSLNDSVEKYLAFAEKAFHKTGEKIFDPDYYLTQAKYLFAINEYDQSEAACQMAVKASQTYNNGLVKAKTYLLLARISKKTGDLKEFVEYLRLSEKEFLLCSDKESSGRSLISVGLLYNDAGMNDLAQKVLVKATKLCEKYSDSLFLGYLYCNISGVYKGSSPTDLTLLTLKKAVTIFTSLKDNKGLGYAQNMIGSYCIEQKKYKEALAWFAKTIHSDTLAGDWQGACFAACNIADVYLTMKKYSPVVSSLAEAETYMLRAADPLSAIVFYNTKARFQLVDKNYNEALANFNTSLKLSGEIRNNNFYLDNLKSIADLYHLTGDESMALLYFRKYVEAGDSIRSAILPHQQQELLSELNSGQLIDMAVKKKDKSASAETNYPALFVSIVGILLMLAVSVKVFGKSNTGVPQDIVESSSGNKGNSMEKAQKNSVSEELQNLIWLKLNKKMQEEKYFLRPELTLHDLAQSLDTNTSYLSKVINELTGQNFNSFVNKYRVEEACSILSSKRQHYLSIEGIALSVGFNSKSAFNAAFKKTKGVTPTEFIEQQKSVVYQL